MRSTFLPRNSLCESVSTSVCGCWCGNRKGRRGESGNDVGLSYSGWSGCQVFLWFGEMLLCLRWIIGVFVVLFQNVLLLYFCFLIFHFLHRGKVKSGHQVIHSPSLQSFPITGEPSSSVSIQTLSSQRCPVPGPAITHRDHSSQVSAQVILL